MHTVTNQNSLNALQNILLHKKTDITKQKNKTPAERP